MFEIELINKIKGGYTVGKLFKKLLSFYNSLQENRGNSKWKETYMCVYSYSREIDQQVRSACIRFFVFFSTTFSNNHSETLGKDERISRTSSGEHFIIQIQDNFGTG